MIHVVFAMLYMLIRALKRRSEKGDKLFNLRKLQAQASNTQLC